MYMYMYVCMYVCLHIYIYIYIYIYTGIHSWFDSTIKQEFAISAYIHMYICLPMHTYACFVYIHITYMQPVARACMHVLGIFV